MVRFKCNLPNNLVSLVNETVVDYGCDYVIGILPDGLSSQLNHCSMYMICEFEEHNSIKVWKNPIAVVARNDIDALEAYTQYTNNTNGSVLCEIYNKCNGIKVEPID